MARPNVAQAAPPSSRRTPSATAWAIVLAAFACAAGILLLQVDRRPGVIAAAQTATHPALTATRLPAHHATVKADPPRVLALMGRVEDYEPAMGMMDLSVGESSYRVRIPNAVASQSDCGARVLLSPGNAVRMTFAAYLDGPLEALTVAPADSGGSFRCPGR